MYRTHICSQIDKSELGKKVQLAGWVRTKRDHGTILFIDLVDASGVVQCVCNKNDDPILFDQLDGFSLESVVSLEGVIIARTPETVNKTIKSGEVELQIQGCVVLSKAQELPFSINQPNPSEEQQLEYRYLYLRRKEMQETLALRTRTIDLLRKYMKQKGFMEIQTPILTSSSPEGARDYIVPSRMHPGKFYALPQAPQQFKQLLMASGVEKYFQIAPCFRDEDARADRLVGEFYQLDFEMAFATQEDIFAILEHVLYNVFEEIRPDYKKEQKFPRIPYKQALAKYGSDKPDLRNPLEIMDITDFAKVPNMFEKLIAAGGRMLTISASTDVPNSFFAKLQEFMQVKGGKGVAFAVKGEKWSGPMANMFSDEEKQKMLQKPDHNTLFLVADMPDVVYKLAGYLRTELGQQLNLIEQNRYAFCLITDFPMFECNDGVWDFMHNPFSMPQSLDCDTADVLSYQYDIVCNGYELASGAVRNHDLALVKQVFAKIGQACDNVEEKFPLYKAFKYGIPPHAGCAPGIDRIIMLLNGKSNVRDIVAFPLNQHGACVLMDAPSVIDEKFLKDLKIKVTE